MTQKYTIEILDDGRDWQAHKFGCQDIKRAEATGAGWSASEWTSFEEMFTNYSTEDETFEQWFATSGIKVMPCLDKAVA